MAFAPDHISSRFKRRGVIALALFVTLTTGATLLATSQSDETPATVTAGTAPAAERQHTSVAYDPDTARRRAILADIASWRDLRFATAADVATETADLIAVDPNLVDARPLSEQPAALQGLQRKPDGSPRLVLGHLSIGAFEPNRPYWRWKSAADAVMPLDAALIPASIGPSNPVRYWEPAWQAQLYGRPEALLDRLIAAGYDGVYLADGEACRLARPDNADADARMAEFVARLARYARTLNPQFVVMLGGAEELLTHTVVREAIDAIAKPDLLFGINAPGQPNDEADIAASLHVVKSAVRGGHPVFVTEHTANPEMAAAARRRLAELGFIADVTTSTTSARPTLWSKVKF